MSTPREEQILLRVGGKTWAQYGVPWRRRDTTTREAPTFTRADSTTCATFIDRRGNMGLAAANIPRLDWRAYLAGITSYPTIPLEWARTNLVLQSQNFGTTWAAVGTPVLTAAQLVLGHLSLDLIEDNDAGVLEGYTQPVTLTGNGHKAISCYVKAQAGNIPTGETHIGLRDETAGTNRCDPIITWDANGVPTVAAMSAGVHLATHFLPLSGVYRFLFQSDETVGTNTHHVFVYPSGLNVAHVGALYVGGFQCENAAYPSSYMKTTTTTITRAAESWLAAFGFGPDQDLTILATFTRPLWADVVGNLGAFPGIVDLGNNTNPFLGLYGIQTPSRQFQSEIVTAGADCFAPAQSIPAGTSLSVSAQYKNLLTAPQTALDVGSGLGAFGTAAAVLTQYGTQQMRLGAIQAGAGPGDLELVELIVAQGLFTRAEMLAA